MTVRELIRFHPEMYLLWGDFDKRFDRPECECEACEEWRTRKGRPTRKELRRLLARLKTPPRER